MIILNGTTAIVVVAAVGTLALRGHLHMCSLSYQMQIGVSHH